MSNRRDAWKYLGGALLAALLLAWVFRGTDPGELWEQLGRATLGGLIAHAALNIGHTVFRVRRWQLLLRPVKHPIPFRSAFTAVVVGYMTSWVVPGRAGEIVRPLILSGREGVPLGPNLGSVVADRLLDAAAVVVLFSLGTWLTPLSGAAAAHTTSIRSAAVVLLFGTGLVLVTMAVAASRRAELSAWVGRHGRIVGWIGRTLLSMARGAQALRTPRLAAGILLHSLLAWLTISLGTWLGVRAAGAEVPFGAILIILPMLVLGVALPTPGGAGGYHALMMEGLMLFGVTEVAAISAGLLVHAFFTVPVILLGVALLWTERISWRELLSAARQLRTLGAEPEPPPPPDGEGLS